MSQAVFCTLCNVLHLLTQLELARHDGLVTYLAFP
jgi:hypothetical protein